MVEFSAVIPVYNKEPHVARALRSVLAQTFPAKEILIIDDASTDRSIEIIEEVAGDQIRLLRREKPGPGGYHARNLGIEKATTDWIAFLDADDAWKPDHLANLNAALENASDGVGCVFTGFAIHNGHDRDQRPAEELMTSVASHEQMDFDGFLRLWLKLGRSPIHTSGVAYQRRVLLTAGGFPADRCKRGGDKDLFLRACAATQTVAVPTISSVYFRDSVNMVSRLTDWNRTPCVCMSLTALMRGAGAERRGLLERLYNLEVFFYAITTWRQQPLDRSQFATYFARRDPKGYLLLQAMLLVPGSRLKTIRSWIRRLRSAWSPLA